jgi:hypothetical protein
VVGPPSYLLITLPTVSALVLLNVEQAIGNNTVGHIVGDAGRVCLAPLWVVEQTLNLFVLKPLFKSSINATSVLTQGFGLPA